MEYLTKFLDQVFGYFIDPSKRLFVGFLGSTFLIALAWLMISAKKSLKNALSTVFDKSVWLSKSAKADYSISIINQLVMWIVSPKLISKLALAMILFESMHMLFSGRTTTLGFLPPWAISLSFTFTLFLLDDFAKYWLHRWLHTFEILWHFHKVHHSAEKLTPFTVLRTHPVEAVLFALRAIIVQALVISTFFYFFGDRFQLLDVLGANLFLFAFNLMGSNLRHSHIAVRYPKAIEKFLISPAQHHIHHSAEKQHFNSNYGAVLALWDNMGNTLLFSEPKKQYTYGLGELNQTTHTLSEIYFTPFKDAYMQLIRWRK